MKVRRVMIAAPKSGSGKTIVTCALLWALKSRGKQVVSCKCGPDYIDPMFHKKVIGVPAKNLDTFFTDEEQTRTLFLNHMEENGFAVLEGVMGLFDGLGGIREEGSSYHLAKVTKTPIIFVIDAKGMGRSVIPLIAGFLSYDKEHLIRGIILNRISKGYYNVIKPLIEEAGVTVLGFLPDRKDLQIGSRHLGLVLPHELERIQEKLQKVSEEFQKTVSVEEIMEIADTAEELERYEKISAVGPTAAQDRPIPLQERPVIAIARDEAFCFYYMDNIQALEENGAEIVYFSPLHDEKLPQNCHALLFGGGYPELYAEELSANSGMRASVRQAAKNGMPVVAECGGFMYLHNELTDQEGNRFKMAGVIPAHCFYTGKSVRFGYIEMQETQSRFLLPGEKIKGHEFHYYDSTMNGEDAIAVKPVSGKEYPCIIESENCWMGFPHLYYPSNPVFARRFVEKARRFQVKIFPPTLTNDVE